MNTRKNHRPFWLAGVFLVLAALACGPVTPTETPTTVPEVGEASPTPTPPPAATDTPVPDVSGPGGCTLNAAYVADVTVPDDTEFAPGTAFVKVWRVRNSGTCVWETGTQLVFVSGDPLGGPAAVDVPPVAPGSNTDVSVNFVAPAAPGTYRSTWQLQSPEGVRFGSQVYVQIVVPEVATEEPTEEATATPTEEPTEEATATPTEEPTETPTATPTEEPSGPDLYISELSIDPPNPQSGDTIHVRVGTYNRGNQAAGPYKVTFQYSSIPADVCVWDVSGSNAHGGRILTCDAVVYNTYTGVATTDVDDAVGETDETNNTANIEIPVPEATGVDLYISEMSVTPSNPHAGDTVTARVGVYNRGSSAAGAFWVRWRYGPDDFDVCTWEVTSMAAHGGRILTCDVTISFSFDTTTTADIHNDIAEAVETNNERTLHVEVSP